MHACMYALDRREAGLGAQLITNIDYHVPDTVNKVCTREPELVMM